MRLLLDYQPHQIDFIRTTQYYNMNIQPTSITFLVYPQNYHLSLSENLQPPKQIEDQTKDNKNNSLEILGSNLSIPTGVSAFSIYDPEKSSQSHYDPNYKQQYSSPDQNVEVSIQSQGFKTRKISKDRKQLSRLETKNLNRFFRSKINQMLRDIKQNPANKRDELKADQLLNRLNESNKIMFSEMRDVIKDEWLQEKLLKCESILMRYVHKGKMGMSSKLVMLKYFNKILKAIRNPDNFTCWK